ncbi:chemotaxis response regulator protein-glutamate methylesterase [Crenobacter sp. SG2305]|uniref:chemotaxis response regulator protein-glutamate methylesterase n=1 Tax=Crenobacter oryzisoli TaxID=3056844 RepID=UPI0025AB257F|nr:chemotaxis response regulator protein-glutamate methylesterase [Crenobacter sp. SG2305]MDN0085174.1 chemotaxis response regulator protein-glutamate methylesterase [Crenobacter sp. SG2305]
MNIGIVNDSPLAVEALRRALALHTDYRISWVAQDGEQAVEMCAWQTPDLVLMDLIMPRLNGIEATRRIMASTPCAILVVTVDIGENAQGVYEAIGLGALDAVNTPTLGGGDLRSGAAPLLDKIERIRHQLRPQGHPPVPTALPSLASTGPAAPPLVAIGASAGGPTALATLLHGLPADFAAALVIVQHIDAAFAAGMAQWLDKQCALPVRLADGSDSLQPGTVLLARGDQHLRLTPAGRLLSSPEPHDHLYRPSIDIFFQSVAQHWKHETLAVLLTGMGSDGAAGLKTLHDQGAYTIAQDQRTSAVYGMPKAAADLGAARAILPIEAIAPALINACH